MSLYVGDFYSGQYYRNIITVINNDQFVYSFKTPLQLKKHETVHTGAKPHQCAVCGRTFREKGTLREHHRIHTGAMPFTCEFCGKSFRFKGILTVSFQSFSLLDT